MRMKRLVLLLKTALAAAVASAFVGCSQQSQDITPAAPQEDPYFVEEEDARAIAEGFLTTSGLRAVADKPIFLLLDETKLRQKGDPAGQPAYYVYSLDGGGFIIVSATKLARPVLGFSLQNDFSEENKNMLSFLSSISGDIQDARARLTLGDPNEDDPYIDPGEEVPGMGKVVVPMMLKTRWNQDQYTGGMLPGGYAIGCLALATGQIMKYWEYPSEAVGYYSYTDRNLGFIEHDYNYRIDWDAMPLINTEPNEMVARFFYGLAMSMNMEFGPESGAIMTDAASALVRHYGYPKDIYVLQRGQMTADEWTPIIEGEINKGRPVLLGGQSSGGGHAFVLDGYTDQDYFHVNWGWGGTSDGWFAIDGLNPDALGTGGGSGGGFNQYQHMMMNFQPPLSVQGDDTDPVVDEEEKDLDPVVAYDPVYGLSQLQAFLSYTKFGTLETASGPERYTFFSDRFISATIGGEVSYTIDPTYSADKLPCWIYIWIDVDNDGYFADYELFAHHDEIEGIAQGTITVPDVIKEGTHRMRVIMSLDGVPAPQQSFMNGEVEDYTITIK